MEDIMRDMKRHTSLQLKDAVIIIQPKGDFVGSSSDVKSMAGYLSNIANVRPFFRAKPTSIIEILMTKRLQQQTN